jgi:uroporphyrinogen-III synthase
MLGDEAGQSGAPTGGSVLITRPPPGDAQTAAAVAALGLCPVLAPCLVIASRPALLPLPARLQAVLVASAQAVGGLPASHHGVRLLAVGDSTAARARAAGFAEVHSAGADAVALALLATRLLNPAGPPLLLAAGAGQGGRLAGLLRQAGFRVLRRVVYQAHAAATLPAPACRALAAGEVRAAMFFSAETARAFARILPAELHSALAHTDALAIGDTTAVALRHLPWHAVRVAQRPTQDGLVALLQ